MSPSKRKRPTTGKGNISSASRRSTGPAPKQRLGLLIFGVAFVLLFAGFAIDQGIGNPSVPSGDVAIVEDAPSDGTITHADFQRALKQTVGQSETKKIPKPGSEEYEQLKEATLNSLLDLIWIQGQAEEMGISATPKEVSDKFKELKEQSFKTAAEYKEFLKKAHFTQADIDERVKLQVVSEKIQKEITESAPKPSAGEVKDYYEAAKSTQYVQPATRDVRAIVNKDKKKVEQAKAILEKDDSPKSWAKVAKKYSTGPTKSNGGLQSNLSEESAKFTLSPEVFKAAKGELVGPVKATQGYLVFEVEKVTPEEVQPFETVKSTIESALQEKAQTAALGRFILSYTGKWKARTFCASGYTIERCNNFKSDGRPKTTPPPDPACYEANPKGGLPKEGCPAPVMQLKPAQPGTNTILAPQGESSAIIARPAQRPQPSGLKPSTETPGLEGLPPGATSVPPTSP